ncbi:MAG TPA: hypothetical protein VGQ99_01845 [Tepidisphaeraceae bacterium]|jgi:drug/metabolite transporter (DMT)-like permease|nr:hypothetical protein [Tepidisphaeraceae bacterium]HEV8604076.1 hypothetical protein [Tepidisphaeraceae bacterium]
MKYTWLFFVAGAVLTWGAYVVTIDHGRTKLSEGLPKTHMAVAAMRAFLFIGLAYCVLAVIVPGLYLKLNPAPAGQDPGFNMKGSVVSTIAGILGAAGALCIVFAVGHGRRQGISPAVVASLVFAFAPIVNCFIAMLWDKPAEAPKPQFWIGLLMAAIGAGLVLAYKPAEAPHGAAGSATKTAAVNAGTSNIQH